MRLLRTFLVLLFVQPLLLAQKGHEIKVKINGYEQDVLYMAYHYGSKQYVNDTVYRQTDDSFVIQGDEPLEPGNYMLVLAPDNSIFDLLINDDEQHFSLEMDKAKMLETVELKGKATDNQLFINYLLFLNETRAEAEQFQTAEGDSETSATTAQKQKDLDARVAAYQRKLISENPESLTAALIKSSIPIDYPEFEGEEQELQKKQWRYTQKHFFDNIDLADGRLLRTALLEPRINHFIDKLQVQHPDTIAVAIDYVLDKLEPAEENFKYFVIHFLNKYARSKIVGMDAVYVHMVENYYRNGKAPWTDADQLKKILDNSARLKPLLIGEIAPDIQLQKRDGSKLNLHNFDSDYTVLYFWRYDCEHCKKSTPTLKEFQKEFKEKGVSIFAVCTKYDDEVAGCWDYVDEQGLEDWTHLVDPVNASKFSDKYNIRSTPQIFILDKNKKIISKRIGADQLADVITRLTKK